MGVGGCGPAAGHDGPPPAARQPQGLHAAARGGLRHPGQPADQPDPQAVQLLDKTEISRARPTWGLDEALATVPGVYAANRYNFSLDQRISIRRFGARSASAVTAHREPLGERRSEEHTSEVQSPDQLVCPLLPEKKRTTTSILLL